MILPLAAAILACGGGGSDTTGPVNTGGTGGTGGTGAVATTSVNIKNRSFTPEDIKVASGATVTWTNSDGENHNVTFDNAGTLGIAGSGALINGGANTALAMPAAAGTYPYHCTLHSGMTGTVQVQ